MKLILADKSQTGIRRYFPIFSRITHGFKEKMEKQPENMMEIHAEKRKKLMKEKRKEFDIQRQTIRVWDTASKISASMLFLEVIVGIEEAFRNPLTLNKLMNELGGLALLAPPLLPIISAIGFEIVNMLRQFYSAYKIVSLEEEFGIDKNYDGND